MSDVNQQVSVPENSSKVANAIAKFTLDVMNAKKQGLTGAALMASIGESAIADFTTALGSISALSGEASSEPIGVAEAFALAGFQVARSLTGK